jgi:hypothetical protein
MAGGIGDSPLLAHLIRGIVTRTVDISRLLRSGWR